MNISKEQTIYTSKLKPHTHLWCGKYTGANRGRCFYNRVFPQGLKKKVNIHLKLLPSNFKLSLFLFSETMNLSSLCLAVDMRIDLFTQLLPLISICLSGMFKLSNINISCQSIKIQNLKHKFSSLFSFWKRYRPFEWTVYCFLKLWNSCNKRMFYNLQWVEEKNLLRTLCL